MPESYAKPALCTRAIPKQATSVRAYIGELPDPDDPLLAFAPYLHKQRRENLINPERQRQFVAVLAATGLVNEAARSIGKSTEALYKLRKMPGAEGFAAAWDEALRWGLERIEHCTMEAALRANDDAANSMLCFVLNRRDRLDWIVDIRDLEPGHWVYEHIRREVLEEVGLVAR